MNPMPYPVSQSVALLVVSCDKYADLWSPFFDLFFRYWSDCPFPVYLLSNTTTAGIAGVREITVGPDVSWSDGLLQGLAQIQENYVFLFLDDLLLTRPVDTTAVETVLKWFISSQGNYIRLTGFPPPDAALTDMVGTVAAHTIYRTGTVLSVWRPSACPSSRRCRARRPCRQDAWPRVRARVPGPRARCRARWLPRPRRERRSARRGLSARFAEI